MLDKTGTLTLGVPEVASVCALDGATEDEVLQTAAIAEQHSEHPLGDVIVHRARKRNLPLREYADLRYFPGKGLTCKDGGSEIIVGSRTLFEDRGLAFFGFLAPIIAALIHVGSELAFILNSARLFRRRGREA